MNSRFVFDTEAIIAFLYNGPGHNAVAELLEAVFTGASSGFLSEMNATEVFYLVARFEGVDGRPTRESLRIADRDTRGLNRRGVEFDRADWRVTGEIKAKSSIPLADAGAVALADEHQATLIVGGDDDFVDLPVQVEIQRFRDHSV